MRTIYLMLLIIVSVIVTAATVTIKDVPEYIYQNRNYLTGIDFTDVETGPFRAILEIYNSETNELIHQEIKDNEGKGYNGFAGSISVTYKITETVSSVYFRVWLTPMGDLNSYILDRIATYPTDGSYPYDWNGNGVTHDIYYDNSLIISDNQEGNGCYCCGITFEAFSDAVAEYLSETGQNQFFSLSSSNMSSIRSYWYAITGPSGCAGAIDTYDMGPTITDLNNLKPGDFVQLWRHSGSGHSVIFSELIKENSEPVGLKYWSTQPSTDGIGYNTEYFGTDSGLNLGDCYFARVNKPFHSSDWNTRIGDANSMYKPTIVKEGFNLIEDFEDTTVSTSCMFRAPSFSGSSAGIQSGSYCEVSDSNANPYWGTPNSKSLYFHWDWNPDASEHFVRATTYNASERPNPTIDLTKGLSLYVLNPGTPVDISLWIRETGVDQPIGENGGTSGPVEQIKNFQTIPNSPYWQYIYFDIPNEEYFEINGNGIIEGTKGTLEALVFQQNAASDTNIIRLYVDDFSQGDRHTNSCTVTLKDQFSAHELTSSTIGLFNTDDELVKEATNESPALFEALNPGTYYLQCTASNYDPVRYPNSGYFVIDNISQDIYSIEMKPYTFSTSYWLYE